MGFKFSQFSKDNLASCHPDLQLIGETAIKCTPMDFAITEGYRTKERQYELYLQGKSRISGKGKNKSKHNYKHSRAFDVVPIINGKASWDPTNQTFLAGIILAIGEVFFKRGNLKHRLRWGGNWDGDGIIIKDQSFIDLPHFELLGVKE